MPFLAFKQPLNCAHQGSDSAHTLSSELHLRAVLAAVVSEALRGGRVPDLCEAQDGADCVRAFFAEQLELRWAPLLQLARPEARYDCEEGWAWTLVEVELRSPVVQELAATFREALPAALPTLLMDWAEAMCYTFMSSGLGVRDCPFFFQHCLASKTGVASRRRVKSDDDGLHLHHARAVDGRLAKVPGARSVGAANTGKEGVRGEFATDSCPRATTDPASCVAATTCLQAVINRAAAAASNSSSAVIVSLPCGRVGTAELSLPSNVGLVGGSASASEPLCARTVLWPCAVMSQNQTHTLVMAPGHDQSVEGIVFDNAAYAGLLPLFRGAWSNQGIHGSEAIVSTASKGLRIEGNVFQGIPTRDGRAGCWNGIVGGGCPTQKMHAVSLSGSSGIIHRNHVMQSGGDALNFNNGEYLITANIVENAGDGCIAMNNNARGIVSDNILRRCNLGIGAGTDFAVPGQPNNTALDSPILISGNIIEDTQTGLALGWYGYAGKVGPVASIASGNTVLRARMAGIEYGGAAAPAPQGFQIADWNVVGNSVLQSGYTQSHPTCDNSTDSLFACCPPNTCPPGPGNHEVDAGKGIAVGQLVGASITANTVSGCLSNAIELSGRAVTVSGNTIRRNDATGRAEAVGIAAAGTDIAVLENHLSGFGNASIALSHKDRLGHSTPTSGATVRGNTVHGAGTSAVGVSVGDGSTHVDVSSNSMRDVGVAVQFEGHADFVVVRANVAMGVNAECVALKGPAAARNLTADNTCWPAEAGGRLKSDDLASPATTGCPNRSDCTLALQALLSSGAETIRVPKLQDPAGPWFVAPLTLPSHATVIFEPGCVVEALPGKAGQRAYKAGDAVLFTAQGVRNLTVVGHGATVKMQRQDYANVSLFSRAEWRHTLRLSAVDNVKIVGLTLEESGGDGVYINAGSSNVHLEKVRLLRHYRQGEYRSAPAISPRGRLTPADAANSDVDH